MPIRYVSKTQDNKNWQVSNLKDGKPFQIKKTRTEALKYAALLPTTEGIVIKWRTGWRSSAYWGNYRKKYNKSINKDKSKQNSNLNTSKDNTTKTMILKVEPLKPKLLEKQHLMNNDKGSNKSTKLLSKKDGNKSIASLLKKCN